MNYRLLTIILLITLAGCNIRSHNKEVDKYNADTAAISKQPVDRVSEKEGALSVQDSSKPYGADYKDEEKKTSAQNNTVQDKYPSKNGK